LELGYRRLWLGPASYEAKRVRGAEQVPLFNYLWFPRRWDRAVLGRFVQFFGEETKRQLDRSFVDKSPPPAPAVAQPCEKPGRA
jgi:hypothetical protein